MHRPRIALSGIVAMLLAGPTLAQNVWIVDDDGGAGVHFTDIPPAITAASPGDVLRVFPGNYSAFRLDKALVIVGQSPGASSVSGLAQIAGVGGGATAVVVSGVTAKAWKVVGCSLPVLLDACPAVWPPYGNHLGFEVTSCIDLRAQRATYKGGYYPTWYGDGGVAVKIGNARVQLSDCTCTGPNGASAGSHLQPHGGHGGHGIETFSSEVHAYRCQITGGNGGWGFSFAGTAGNGGDGLSTQKALVAGLAQHLIVAGVGGKSVNGYGWDGLAISANWSLRYSGVSTQGLVVGPAGTEIPNPPDPSLQLITAFPAAGQKLDLRVDGPPGAQVELVLGREPVIVDQPGLQEDILVLETRRVIAGPIPSSGALDWTIGISPALQHGTVFLVQAELLYPAGDLRRTNSVTVVLR